MLTILFFIFFIGIFGRLAIFALKAAWGISKIILWLIIAPIVLVAMLASGLVYVAIIALAIGGIVSLIKTA